MHIYKTNQRVIQAAGDMVPLVYILLNKRTNGERRVDQGGRRDAMAGL